MAPVASYRYAEIMRDVENLVQDHIAHQKDGTRDRSKLKFLVPSIGLFFTPLPMEQAFLFQDERRKISARRFVPPSFNDIRLTLNTAQIMGLVATGGPQLVTFDGDLTLYDDGKSLATGDVVIQRILRLLMNKTCVAIVTAAGYTDAQRYYERLLGLLEALKEGICSGSIVQPQFAVMGGESQYLFVFDIEEPHLLRMVPRSIWKLDIMKTWTEKEIEALLDAAEEALNECISNLDLSAQVLRKERAVGIIPSSEPGAPRLTREQLEETVLVTQQRIEMMNPKIPFSAFNGGNDIFVDIGGKDLGVLACRNYFGGIPPERTIHCGDQFLSLSSSNDFRARLACTTAWVANPTETVQLLDELELHSRNWLQGRLREYRGVDILELQGLTDEEFYAHIERALDSPPSNCDRSDDTTFKARRGSQTTLAQFGITETKSPPKLRFKSRMFPAEKKGEWEPYKVLQRRVKKKFPKNPEATTSDDAVMGGTAEVENEEVEEIQYYEDRETDEGAVWPIVSGYIVNWSCFFALLTHIYNTLSPTLKSPMVIAVQPAFTLKCREKICQFLFEKFKIPGLYLIDAASAAASAFNIGDAMEGTGMGVIVDVGYDKCDVTAMGLHDPVSLGRLISIPNCGGRTMTNNLHRLLGHKGFTYDMCEQLKRSSICEILPVSSALPAESNGISQMNPAAAASTGMNVPISKAADTPSGLPRGPGPGTEAGDEKLEENEGVLDVASIVASGKTSEILAKKEREKAEKAAKKAKAGAANDSKSVKLPNFQKAKATFYYDEPQCLNAASGSAHAKDADATATATLPAEKGNPSDQARPAQPLPAMVRKEVEVGAERFQADGPNHELIWIIADSIKRCVSDAPVEQRSAMWENIMVVGNGSKIKGFKESLMAMLHAKYLISPSSGTIFTSELPSDFSTPIPTGANTPNPQGSNAGALGHHAPGVNPLLVAATHASNPSLAPPGQQQYQQFGTPQGRSKEKHVYPQTPTSIKYANPYDYLPEWREHGFEEGAFFGAIMHAHGVFQYDVDNEKAYLTRTQYNADGPAAIKMFTY
ncbi:MAG: hypothetical protein LQ340_001524 [Diploschistes diacapsis]|nr:MAG: hypothetical protein LQ340_001524 [Diploschistes diacapsis]